MIFVFIVFYLNTIFCKDHVVFVSIIDYFILFSLYAANIVIYFFSVFRDHEIKAEYDTVSQKTNYNDSVIQIEK
jgi:hypothetical protein